MNVTVIRLVLLCVVGMSLCFFLPTITCRPSYVKQLRSKICHTGFLSVEEIAFRNLEIIVCVVHGMGYQSVLYNVVAFPEETT